MFDKTPRTVFRQACEGGQKELGALFVMYRPPACKYVRWKFPSLASEVEEIVDEFLVDKLVTGNMLQLYVPAPGRRFRSYFRAALYRFCVSRLRRRAGAPRVYSLDEAYDAARAPETDPFDLLWARQVLGRTLRGVKRACEAEHSRQQRAAWDILKARFLRPLRKKPPVPYTELVGRLGFSSAAVAQTAATCGKKLADRMLLDVIAEYCGIDDPAAEREELWRLLRRIFSAWRKDDHPGEE